MKEADLSALQELDAINILIKHTLSSDSPESVQVGISFSRSNQNNTCGCFAAHRILPSPSSLSLSCVCVYVCVCVQTSLAGCLRTISDAGSNGAAVVAKALLEKKEALAATKQSALLFFDVIHCAFRLRIFKRHFAEADAIWQVCFAGCVVQRPCVLP